MPVFNTDLHVINYQSIKPSSFLRKLSQPSISQNTSITVAKSPGWITLLSNSLRITSALKGQEQAGGQCLQAS